MNDLHKLAFSAWMLLQHLDIIKHGVETLVFGGMSIYSIYACLRLPPQTVRGVGASSSPSVLTSRMRRKLRWLAVLICSIDIFTIAAYLRVWSTMKDVDRPTLFPAGHHLYALWEGCLSGVAIQLGLGVVFVLLETDLKGSR